MISKNQIKHVKSLHQKKYREQERCFIAEGTKVVNEIILHNSDCIVELFCTKEYLAEQHLPAPKKIKFTSVSEDELQRISALATPNQVLAVCRYFEKREINTDLKKQFSFYLDDIRDPGNLGTILRIADWFGVNEIFCSPQSTELYNPKTIQSAMGAFLRVHVHYTDLKELTAKHKPAIYGAVLNGENMYTQKLGGGLIVIGNEANGISQTNLGLITHPITIPAHSHNQTESLNAAMATAIICSEFARQQAGYN